MAAGREREEGLKGLLSPGPSLETEGEDDQDYVASELEEGSVGDSSDDESSSGEDGEGSSGEDEEGGSPQVAPEVAEVLRGMRALCCRAVCAGLVAQRAPATAALPGAALCSPLSAAAGPCAH